MRQSTFNPLKRETFIQETRTKFYTPVDKTVIDEEGNTVIETLLVSEDDYESFKSVPKEADYKLKDLLSAGVPLKDISVSGLLDSSDFADISIRKEKLSNSMLSKVQDYLAKKSFEKEPIVEPKPEE